MRKREKGHYIYMYYRKFGGLKHFDNLNCSFSKIFKYCTHNFWGLFSGATSVDVYFPSGKWYDFVSQSVTSATGGETKTVPAPIDVIPVSKAMQMSAIVSSLSRFMCVVVALFPCKSQH